MEYMEIVAANLAALAGCVINTSRVMSTLVHLVLGLHILDY